MILENSNLPTIQAKSELNLTWSWLDGIPQKEVIEED